MEDIEELEKTVELRKEKCKGKIEHNTCIVGTKNLDNLIAGYKELEEKKQKNIEPVLINNTLYFIDNELYNDLLKDLRKEHISKSKVKEKIEELKEDMLNENESLEIFYRKKFCHEVLQELLESED